MFDHFDCVKVELHDGIAYVRMNRPEKRNAMNPRLHDEMEEALTHLEVDPDAKVIVPIGLGGDHLRPWRAAQLRDLRRERGR